MDKTYQMTTDIPESILTPDNVETRLGTLRFFDGFPDEETVQKVYDNLDFQRGVQAYLAALPAADMCAMREGYRELRSGQPDTADHRVAHGCAHALLPGEHRDRVQLGLAGHQGRPSGHRAAAGRARSDERLLEPLGERPGQDRPGRRSRRQVSAPPARS